MTNAGWYPDPAGTPNTYRYWDGQSWSQETTTDPQAAGAQGTPAQPPAQPPAQGVAGQQWGPTPAGPTGPGGGGKGKIIAIAGGGVVALVVLALLAFFGVRALTDDDGEASAQDSTSSRSQESGSGSTGSSGPTSGSTSSSAPPAPLGTLKPTSKQCTGGIPATGHIPKGDVIKGGHLTLSTVELKKQGFDPVSPGLVTAFTWTDRFAALGKEIEANWYEPVGLGGLLKRNGFTSVEQAARVVEQCNGQSVQMYSGAYSLTEVSATPIKVDGHPAFSMISEVRVDEPGLSVPGDRVQVIVVDTGDDRHYGMFLMGVPIGDQKLIALQKRTAKALHVAE